jgi:deoxyribonuclease V
LIDKHNKTKHARNKIDKQTENKVRKLIEIQRKIASRVVLKEDYSLEAVAGVDQAFLDEVVISRAVLLDAPLKIKDSSSIQLKTDFLYIPGFLSFREGPTAIKAVRGLKETPTLLFVDGAAAPTTLGLPALRLTSV